MSFSTVCQWFTKFSPDHEWKKYVHSRRPKFAATQCKIKYISLPFNDMYLI